MKPLNLKIGRHPAAYRPGEPIAGEVEWWLDDAPQRLEVRLFWYTCGKGTEDVSVVDTVAIENPASRGGRSFRFVAPAAPHSFSGTFVSVVWAVELVADEEEQTDRVELVVAPDAREIELEKVESPDFTVSFFDRFKPSDDGARAPDGGPLDR